MELKKAKQNAKPWRVCGGVIWIGQKFRQTIAKQRKVNMVPPPSKGGGGTLRTIVHITKNARVWERGDSGQ